MQPLNPAAHNVLGLVSGEGGREGGREGASILSGRVPACPMCRHSRAAAPSSSLPEDQALPATIPHTLAPLKRLVAITGQPSSPTAAPCACWWGPPASRAASRSTPPPRLATLRQGPSARRWRPRCRCMHAGGGVWLWHLSRGLRCARFAQVRGDSLAAPALPDTSLCFPAPSSQLNLARALAGAGRPEGATRIYEELEVTAELYDQPPAWLAFAAARQAAGNAGGAQLAAASASDAGVWWWWCVCGGWGGGWGGVGVGGGDSWRDRVGVPFCRCRRPAVFHGNPVRLHRPCDLLPLSTGLEPSLPLTDDPLSPARSSLACPIPPACRHAPQAAGGGGTGHDAATLRGRRAGASPGAPGRAAACAARCKGAWRAAAAGPPRCCSCCCACAWELFPTLPDVATLCPISAAPPPPPCRCWQKTCRHFG